jgi:transposase
MVWAGGRERGGRQIRLSSGAERQPPVPTVERVVERGHTAEGAPCWPARPPELLDRGARLVFDSGRPIAHVARDLGLPSETLRKYVRQIEADEGLRPDLPTAAEREEIKALRKENYELRRANEILKAASVFFATELDQDRTK